MQKLQNSEDIRLRPQFTVAQQVGAALEEEAGKQKRGALRQGVNLHIRTTVTEQDGSELWLGELVDLLLADPAMAKLSNAELLAMISERLELARTLPASRMSKDLSARRRDMAERKLREAGYPAHEIKTGSDIKARVKAGKKRCAGIEATITTGFQPDGIVLDGYLHKYRKRDITPSGQPWHDFNVRFCDSDIPLGAVLKMRGISIGEFQSADERACANATPQQMAYREALSRPGVMLDIAAALQATVPVNRLSTNGYVKRVQRLMAA